MPVLLVPEELRDDFAQQLYLVIDGARKADEALQVAGKKLIRKRLKDVRGKLETLSLQFWQRSERLFWPLARALLADLKADANADTKPRREHWHRQGLVQTALQLFDERVGRLDLRAVDPGQVAEAYNGLRRTLYGKKLRTALDLPLPAKKKKPTHQEGRV